MYQALYRKYRPRCFCDVAGQEHITETLRRQIINDRLSHAYLFVGTRGTGKTTCAKILSRAVNCLEPVEGEPCNKCIFCVGIEDGSILDVLELDAASNNSVDNVRELRDEAIYSPATVKKRVYIVDEVHMLSLSAFNALLKILEEPPEHILFVLATTELHKVPATIQGRCQKFSFKRLPPSVLIDRLNLVASKEGLSLTPEAAERLASLADGSMRDVISLLDQCAYDEVVDIARIQDTLGLAGQQELVHLVEAVASRDIMPALKILDDLYNDGRDMASLLNELTSLIRDLLVFKLSPDSGLLLNSGYSQGNLSALSKKLTPERLFFCLDILKTALSGLQRGGSSKLSVEMCLFKMCADEKKPVAAEPQPSLAVTKAEPQPSPEKAPAPKPQAPTEKTPEAQPPAPKPEPQPTPAAGEPDSFWAKTLDFLKNEPSVYALLSDSSKVQARKKDDAVVVNVPDEFTANLVKTEFSELIKDSAKKALGHDVVILTEIVSIVDDNENKRGKLESLSAFDIVNFE